MVLIMNAMKNNHVRNCKQSRKGKSYTITKQSHNNRGNQIGYLCSRNYFYISSLEVN